MNVKATALNQYVRLANHAVDRVWDIELPAEGWIATVRKALGMSVRHLASRTGVTRDAIYQAEANERIGAISFRQMEKLADALGGRFVYAIVPNDHVGELVLKQARKKAAALVQRSNAHMALEAQGLPSGLLEEQIENLAQEAAREKRSNLWSDQ